MLRQMPAARKVVRPGQRVRFLYTRRQPGVRAWDVPDQPDLRSIDLPRYRTLLQRAVETVLGPIQQSVCLVSHLDAQLAQAGNRTQPIVFPLKLHLNLPGQLIDLEPAAFLGWPRA